MPENPAESENSKAKCGGVYRNGPHRLTGSGIIERVEMCCFIGIFVVLLEEVCPWGRF